MKARGKLCAAVAAAMVAAAPAGMAKDQKADQAPVSWGMQSGQTGCVIFRESEEQTSTMTNGQVQYFTVKQLEVVDQQNAKLPHKKYSETKDDLTALQNFSEQNHVKFVKIPKKYTPAQLQAAQAMCKDGMAGQ